MALANTILTLKDLPKAPEGKMGWPWTEESSKPLNIEPDRSEWPCISVVTPSYNQGQFIEETIRSVLLQNYPNIECIIIDGGSTDNTLEIIERYQQYITYWVSEPDNGQSDALNKGFRKATGQLIGWQNSDDFYHPDAFSKAAETFLVAPNIDLIYGCTDNINAEGEFIRKYPVSAFDICEMIPYLNMCNQSMFFSNKIFQENNFIDESFHHAMDLEFLIRIALKGYEFHFHSDIIGYYRVHDNSKGSVQNDVSLKDSLRIYRYISQYPNVKDNIKNKAMSSIYWLCLESFRQLELNTFHNSLKELLSQSGLKYLLSFLGADNLQSLMKSKAFLKPKFNPK
jgi:glycosyltransferase involved in cell wall biosynthesis